MRVFISLSITILLILSTLANVEAEPKVDLADLADLSADKLDSLRDPHHQLAIAEIQEAGAKAMATRAKEAVKDSKREKEAKDADAKAAKAELDAAKKNNDSARIRSAENLVKETQARLATANALKDWRDQEEKVSKAQAALAKVNIDLMGAQLQLARVELVIAASTEAARRYQVSEFRGEMAKVKKELDKAQKKVDQEKEKSQQAEARWTKYSLESN